MDMQKYFAIIVSYNPNVKRLVNNCRSLKEQGFNVIVVDNGSDVDLKDHIHDNDLVKLNKNKGIATALNVGMKTAKERGALWVLSLDQDTEIAPNLLEEYKKNILLKDVGALSPRIVRRGEKQKKYSDNIEVIERCPTSGFFMTVSLWEEIGRYDDWMFIDYVDYDICKRIRNRGLKIYRVNTTHIIQELGKLQVNHFFDTMGRVLHIRKLRNFAKVYNHSPLRNYYFVRNSLYYMYKYKNSIDMKREISFVLRWEIKKLVLEHNKLENIRSIIKGVKAFKARKRQLKRSRSKAVKSDKAKDGIRLNAEVTDKGFVAHLMTQVRKMQLKDWISLFLLGVSFIPGKIWKLLDRHIWVVSEYEGLARDNGYWFFKYLRDNYPNKTVYYPIAGGVSDERKIDALGNKIVFSSFLHYMLFWAAEKQFTSSKNAGFPSRICEDLVQWNFHRFQYIMLNHGITRGKSTVVDASKTNFDFICTCSEKDKEIIVKENGQPDNKVLLTGFARHDNLDSSLYDSKQLLVMPTWRSWINYKFGRSESEKKQIIRSFLSSDYYRSYLSLINNKKLIGFLEREDMHLVFYLHDYAQYYSRYFTTSSDRIIIAESKNYDIQTLLKQSALLITDYSSVCYDFAYMHKPVLYYQFDKEEFEYHQYAAGDYYSYEDDGMGELFYDEEPLIQAIIDAHEQSYRMKDKFVKRVDRYFVHHDRNNCERIYKLFAGN